MSDTFVMPSALAAALGALASEHPNGAMTVSADGPIMGVFAVEVIEEETQRDEVVTQYLVVLGNGQRADGTFGQIPTVVKR